MRKANTFLSDLCYLAIPICLFLSTKTLLGLESISILSEQNNTLATDVYIDPSGSDATGDGTMAMPWASLSYACSQAVIVGDKIHINPGNYTDNNQCVLAVGVDIEGAGSEVVTIHSSYNDWYLIAQSTTETDGNHNVSGFTLDGNNKTLAHGMLFYGRNNVQVHHLKIQNVESFGLQIYADNNGVNKSTPPNYYLKNIEVNDCTISNCGKQMNGGEWSSSCLSIGHLDGAAIHDNIISEDVGGGIIFWETGWFKGTRVYNNNITVTGTNPIWGSQIAIELWNLMDDCSIYNNTSNNWFSLVKGEKNNGTHSVRVYDNRIIFDSPDNPKEGVELGLALYDAEMYNNYIENGKFGVVIWGSVEAGVFWHVSNITIHHNIFYNHHNDYTFGVFINPSVGETYSDIHIYNNVFDGVDEGVQILNTSGGIVKNTKIINNVFTNVPNAVLCQGGMQIQDTQVSYNLYSGDNIFIAGTPTTNPTVDNNINAFPDIESTGNKPSPFYLANDESANMIDAGVDVGLSFLGAAPDIGAYEFETLLPVSYLSSLTARLQNEVILLSWQTAEEFNADYYEIERSANGRDWATLTKIKAFNQSHTYQLIDKTPLSPISYYRLKQVDYDASFSISKIVSIRISESWGLTKIFPNPTKGNLFIDTNKQITSVEIFNYLGKRISYISKPSANQLQLANLNNGIYLLKINSSYSTSTHSFIVRH